MQVSSLSLRPREYVFLTSGEGVRTFQGVREAVGGETPGEACVCTTVYPCLGAEPNFFFPNDSVGMLAITATPAMVSQKWGKGIRSIQRRLKTQTPCWLTGEGGFSPYN